jgi:hypothetical protein
MGSRRRRHPCRLRRAAPSTMTARPRRAGVARLR